MLCKQCYRNRIRREGGEFGLCWQHKKTKCRLCGELSAGKLYCVSCEHDSDIARWRAESKPSYFDEDHEFLQAQLRKEKLSEAKYHVYRAVEIIFRAMVLTMEALWGGIKESESKQNIDVEEFKKAA